LPRVPRFILCSDTLKTASPSSYRLPIDQAHKCQWISWNSRSHINALIIDCDNSEDWRNGLRHLLAQGVPAPTYVVTSPKGTGHIVWFFPIGIRRDNRKRMRLFEGIRDRLNREIGGDTQFKGYLTKNPLHAAYRVESFTGQNHELQDFIGPLIEWSDEEDYVLPPKIKDQVEEKPIHLPALPKSMAEAIGAKGSRVWEAGRQHVYRLRTSDRATILSTLEHHARALGSPISAKALNGMAGRISRWMAAQPWANGKPASELRDIDFGVMTREADAISPEYGSAWRYEIKRPEKLRLSAERTNKIRNGKSDLSLIQSIQVLAMRDELITQASISEMSGLGIATVKRAWKKNPKGITRSYPFFPFSSEGAGRQSSTLKEVVHFLNEGIRIKIFNIKMIGEYQRLASQMKKRGASPQSIPSLPPNYTREAAQARRQAEMARRDCVRRHEKNEERKAMKARRATRLAKMAGWANTRNHQGFDDFLKSEKARWEALEIFISPEDREKLNRHRMRMYVTLKRIKSEWQQAKLKAARRGIFRVERDNLDLKLEVSNITEQTEGGAKIIPEYAKSRFIIGQARNP
jgi:hypothetical protein